MEKYKIIREEALKQLVKLNCQSSYMILILSQILLEKNITAFLTAKEVCEVVEISYEQLEQARKTNRIKATKLGGTFIYSPYDIAILAENINRRERMKFIDKMQDYILDDNQQ